MTRARRSALFAGLLAFTLLTAACGDSDENADDASSVTGLSAERGAERRPEVVFAAAGPVLDIPSEVPSGFVDVRVKALEGEGGAHFVLARLRDGVTYDQIEASVQASGDAEFFDLVDVVGGNGTITAGDEMSMALELLAGDYVALNIYGGATPQLAFGQFRAVDTGNVAPVPEEEGTITLGPGMQMAVPDDFDGTGVWRYENRDPEVTHEAAMVRLAPERSADDLVEWFHTQAGPPPIEGEFGGMGAIGPGNQGWVDFSGLTPGDYAMVCFVPGPTGIPHAGDGMVAQVAVGDSDT
jgi:hypothetical protein